MTGRTAAISVLLPVRNAAGTVAAAVGSMCRQRGADLELLAIDDGSTDDTARVLAALARADRRVRVVRTPPLGLVAALNRGLAETTAPLVARMDADDESHPERLAQSVAALEAQPELSGVGTQVEVFRDDRPVSPNLLTYASWLNSLTSPAALFADRLVESPLCHPSVLLKRAALEQVGGYRDVDLPEDWDLWLRLLERGHGLSCVPRVLHRWRDHDRRLTRTDARYARAGHLRLKAGVLAARHRGQAVTVWGAGETGLSLSRLLREAGVSVSAFIDVNPRKVGMRIDDTPVHPMSALGAPTGPHLLAAVGAKGARSEIRAHLRGLGWREGEHFTCVA